MKKVLALVLAVMMVSVMGFAVPRGNADDADVKYFSSVAPNSTIDVDAQDGIGSGAETATVQGTTSNAADVTITIPYTFTYAFEDGEVKDSGTAVVDTAHIEGITSGDVVSLANSALPKKLKDLDDDNGGAVSALSVSNLIGGAEDVIFRSINSDNYSVSSVRYITGKNLIKGVSISDKDENVQVEFVDDLNNTTAKSFALNYTLRGKGKMVIKDVEEAARYYVYTGNDTTVGARVSIPSVKITMTGTVGYGKVKAYLGGDSDQDLDGLASVGVIKSKDIVNFARGNDIGDRERTAVAGSYTADAILTEEYGEMLTLEARVYSGDTLFFDVDYKPDREVIGTLADVNGDLDFFSFTSHKDFITFNSTARLIFNDANEDAYVYEIKDKKLSPVGNYDEDEGCWVVKARTLGTYVVSDTPLDQYMDLVGTDDVANPDTGANDVVGIATALAAVALVSAAAVSLKK